MKIGYYPERSRMGFTLIEILVVMTIIVMLVIAGFMSFHRQIDKANDARRKDDLQRLSTAFEDYYNDHNCYPPAEWFDDPSDCGSDQFQPYLSKIPCDPVTRQPYEYYLGEPVPECPRNYRILTLLDNDSDPTAADLGFGEEYNYGVASSNISVSLTDVPGPGASANPSPSPTSSPSTGYSACAPAVSPYPASCTYRGTVQPNCVHYWEGLSCDIICKDVVDPDSDYICPE